MNLAIEPFVVALREGGWLLLLYIWWWFRGEVFIKSISGFAYQRMQNQHVLAMASLEHTSRLETDLAAAPALMFTVHQRLDAIEGNVTVISNDVKWIIDHLRGSKS